MKKFFKTLCIVAILFFQCGLCFAQTDSIYLSGTLKDLGNNGFWISFVETNGKTKSFVGTAKEDQFSIKLPKLAEPAIARFDVRMDRGMKATVNGERVSNPAPVLDLFVYNKNIEIKGDAAYVQLAMVTGDSENNLFNVYKQNVKDDELKSYLIMVELFQSHYGGKTLEKSVEMLHNEVSAAQKRIFSAQKEFVKSNPDALTSLFLMTRLQNIFNANDYTAVWNKMSPRFKTHPMAKSVIAYVQKVSNTLEGMPAINFERIDKNGKQIKLADFKGKTVLLDFWGSWCGPCRASHPHLKNLYNKYKKQGFEIIAIAQERGKTLQESKSSWLKAIADDDINWIHVLNQDGISQQDLVKSYQVNAFPTKILVDKNGKIILRITASATDDIDQELKKIYGF